MSAGTLEQVLVDAREEAALLRRAGHDGQATYVEDLCDRVKDSAEDFIRRLSLSDAKLKSGLTERTLRRRFRDLHLAGLAGYDKNRQPWFSACAIPQRASTSIARERGRRRA